MDSCVPSKGANGEGLPGRVVEVDVRNLLVFKNNCERIFVDVLDVTLKEKPGSKPLSACTHETEQMTRLPVNDLAREKNKVRQ